MIHLFNACQCQPCQQCCGECAFACQNWFNKPLGPYVVLAMMLSGLEIAMCLGALVDEKLPQCPGLTPRAKEFGVENWLHVQFGLACLNFMFAPYIQHRLWQNLQQEAAEVQQMDAEKSGVPPAMAQPDVYYNVSKRRIKEAFWNVFLYDFGVCGYVFALFGSGFWSFLGPRWFDLRNPICDPNDYVSNTVQVGGLFVVFVTFYFICFTMYMQCVSSIEVNPSRPLMTGAYALAAQQAAAHGMPAHGMPGKPPPGQQPLFGGVPSAPAPMAGPGGVPMAGPGCDPYVMPRRTPMQRAFHPGMVVKLIACVGLDLMGDASYFIPGLGEGIDIAYAPAQAIALKMMFHYSGLPILGFTEEILPGTDIIPSATIGWLLEVLAPDNKITRAIGIRSDYSP